ncbi:MAG: isochorismatase family protein [Planctomycetes bacterium]|nr:isochorismatase family protein [Planctomycetota bacterium]
MFTCCSPKQKGDVTATDSSVASCGIGSSDLRLPDELRGPLQSHLQALRGRYIQHGWAGRVGFGARPVVIVIDLAKYWLDPGQQIGSSLSAVVLATRRVLDAARAASVPIFFTTFAHDPAEPPSPHDQKLRF